MQGAGYDVGSKFARGGINVAAVNVVCFDLTIDKEEAERAALIVIILNAAKIMHHIFRCIHKNNEEERRHERLRYRKKRAYFFA